jgi:hypothetical protein
MNRRRQIQGMVVIGVALSLAGILLAQGEASRQLIVNGKATNAVVLRVDGRLYVDLDALAQITNGTMTVGTTEVVLTIPSANGSAGSNGNSSADAAAAQATQGLSRNFASAAIATVAEMKEWTGALGTMVTYGLAADTSWAQTYHDRVEASLAQAGVAASTSSDRDALRLLNNQFSNLSNWASTVIAARQAMNGDKTMDPNALQTDPALAKITSCSRFLNSMLVSGSFSDNASCD